MKKTLFLIFIFLIPTNAFSNVTKTVSIDDTTYQLLIREFCPAKGWTEKVKDINGDEIDNPVSCSQFIDNNFINYAFDEVERYESKKQGAAASDAAIAQVRAARKNAQISVS